MYKILLTTLLTASLFIGCGDDDSTKKATEDKEVTLEHTTCSAISDGPCIDPNEDVTLFNSYAYYSEETNMWHLQVRGWIYEPEYGVVSRTAFVTLLQTVIDITTEPSFFEKRIAPFLVDNEEDESIIVRIGDKNYKIAKSNGAGLFSDEIMLSSEDVIAIKDNNYINYSLLMPTGDARVFKGKIELIADKGVMVVSDIDDTIKVTEVYISTEKMLENTFLKIPKKTDYTQELFYNLRNENDFVNFSYVSGSPWQLYDFVHTFVQDNGYYDGAFFLKELRLNPLTSSLYDFIDSDSTYDYKIEVISTMMEHFPHKTFVLIGDSGEKDPEVFGYLYQNNPEQIGAVVIRNVTQESKSNRRMQVAFGEYASQISFIDK